MANKTLEKVELLAPAGSYDALKAAIENGADAVYFGGKSFNARYGANNFSEDDLKRAVHYCRLKDVKSYLTLNILIGENEMKHALDLANEAYDLGVDALIVQDIGAAALIKRYIPDFKIHGSTQMTIYDEYGVKALEKAGFDRVVLARELNIEEIGRISQNCNMPLEVFIHGALCVSYSGQCLMSSIIGGRSGNRGKCAQPCRLPVSINGSEAGYHISPKDLCTLEFLNEILDTNVVSLKIEGRMKNPEYVATVVRIYRKYLDIIKQNNSLVIPEKQDVKDLTQIFNRGGFTRGFIGGSTRKDFICKDKPKNAGIPAGVVLSRDTANRTIEVLLSEDIAVNDGIEIDNGIKDDDPGALIRSIVRKNTKVEKAYAKEKVVIGYIKGTIRKGDRVFKTSDAELNRMAQESYVDENIRKIQLKGFFHAKFNEKPYLKVRDDSLNEVMSEGSAKTEKAINLPLTAEKIREQLMKTGNTPFAFTEIEIEIENDISLPVKVINNLRRDAIEKIIQKRVQTKRHNVILMPQKEIIRHTQKDQSGSITLNICKVREREFFYDLNARKIKRIYLPFEGFFDSSFDGELIDHFKKNGTQIFCTVRAITKGKYDTYFSEGVSKAVKSGIQGFMLGNIGTISRFYPESGLKFAGDYHLNVYNSESADALLNMGFSSCTLSVELNLAQIKELSKYTTMETEVISYGRIELMKLEYDLCGEERVENKFLLDRKNEKMPLFKSRFDDRTFILNAKPVFMADKKNEILQAGADNIRIDIWDEDLVRVNRLIDLYSDNYDDKSADELMKEGFTRGHFTRGV